MLFNPLEPVGLPREEVGPEVGEATSSLALLKAVYADPLQPLHRRMRAAIAALPFEHPKLAIVANVGPSYADALEEAIRRQRSIGGPPATVIEAADEGDSPRGGGTEPGHIRPQQPRQQDRGR